MRHNTNQITPPLPEDRVSYVAVFEVIGVDMDGTFRAVHLDLFISLSTKAFIQVSRIFIARLGHPAVTR
ncbi:hypothetical protein PR048_009162 [Dryococelus australis]|uniref:Uncharacterized protein n=1 Tax=Dryococelus australis TaxID=614101 RepID=A0ABQ9HZ49_9NEOP|nr:hypothetical protein PR048_009162 [Dryococelus australis]